MIGADMTQMDDSTLALLTNADVLAMLSQECSGKQVYRCDDAAVWCSRNRATGEIYVALFNLSDAPAEISVDGVAVVEALGIDAIPEEKSLFDLWEKTTERQNGTEIRASVAAHGVRAFGVTTK
jgi:hypothetical protein